MTLYYRCWLSPFSRSSTGTQKNPAMGIWPQDHPVKLSQKILLVKLNHLPQSMVVFGSRKRWDRWLIVHPPIGRKNTTYTLPSGGLYATYHLLREPETTIDPSKTKHDNYDYDKPIFGFTTTETQFFATKNGGEKTLTSCHRRFQKWANSIEGEVQLKGEEGAHEATGKPIVVNGVIFWAPYKWPKINGFHWGYDSPV